MKNQLPELLAPIHILDLFFASTLYAFAQVARKGVRSLSAENTLINRARFAMWAAFQTRVSAIRFRRAAAEFLTPPEGNRCSWAIGIFAPAEQNKCS